MIRKKQVNKKRWRYLKNRHSSKTEPSLIRSIIDFSDFVVDVHTDIVIYDFQNERIWKGDLV